MSTISTETVRDMIITEKDTYEFTGVKLGTGSFASIYEVDSKKLKKTVAVKMISNSEITISDKQQIDSEINIMKSLKHPNVLKLYDNFANSSAHYTFMERMMTDLLEEILRSNEGKLTSRMTRFFMYQLCTGLKYLHNKDIVHCDLKPENILLDKFVTTRSLPLLKLCDFNYARQIGKLSKRISEKGTRHYMAPEILYQEPHDRCIDIWSLGVIMYVTLVGKFPFVGKDENQIGAQIKNQLKNPKVLYQDECFQDDQTSQFIKAMLMLDPKQRSSMGKLMRMDYFYRIDLKKDLDSLQQRIGKNFVKYYGKLRKLKF